MKMNTWIRQIVGLGRKNVVSFDEKKYGRIYKSIAMYAGLLLSVLMLNGCSLAVEDAGDEPAVVQDKLVGAFITTESLDLFDMEAYLNDHADEFLDGITSGSDSVTIDGNAYSERLYATVHKHDRKDPGTWEVQFGDAEGICFFDAVWQNEGEEPFSMVIADEEICDINSHLTVTDTGEEVALTGTMYVLPDDSMEEVRFFVNPVYQTGEGEIYLVAGNCFGAGRDMGGSWKVNLDGETTITEDGETMYYSGAVEVTFELMKQMPVNIRFQFMNEDLEIVAAQEYVPGTIPAQMDAPAQTVCVIVETVWEDGSITREMFEPEDEQTIYAVTFYKLSGTALGKSMTEIVWE